MPERVASWQEVWRYYRHVARVGRHAIAVAWRDQWRFATEHLLVHAAIAVGVLVLAVLAASKSVDVTALLYTLVVLAGIWLLAFAYHLIRVPATLSVKRVEAERPASCELEAMRAQRTAFRAFYCKLHELAQRITSEVFAEAARGNIPVAAAMYKAWLADAEAAFAEASASGCPLGGWDFTERGPLDHSDYLMRRSQEWRNRLLELARPDSPIWSEAFPTVEQP